MTESEPSPASRFKLISLAILLLFFTLGGLWPAYTALFPSSITLPTDQLTSLADSLRHSPSHHLQNLSKDLTSFIAFSQTSLASPPTPNLLKAADAAVIHIQAALDKPNDHTAVTQAESSVWALTQHDDGDVVPYFPSEQHVAVLLPLLLPLALPLAQAVFRKREEGRKRGGSKGHCIFFS